MRKRTSIIWQMPKNEFESLVKKSSSMSDIIRAFDLVIASGNYRTVKQRLEYEKIDYSHIPLGLNSNKNRNFDKPKIALEKVMIKNSTYQRGHLKRRLLEEGILENKCSECGQEENWNDKKLVMVLDHINGVNNDHRKENIRMLCPNCNSQTSTFAGRNSKKK